MKKYKKHQTEVHSKEKKNVGEKQSGKIGNGWLLNPSLLTQYFSFCILKYTQKLKYFITSRAVT